VNSPASKPALKAPFPYFGGKSSVAPIVWERLGDVDNFVEPFCGSAAVLLARPTPPRIETVNDADCYVANFWRATATCPEEVARWADWPVNEADLHSRHRWLVLSHSAAEFRRRMRTEPGYFDCRVAGWWCWGLCCWIGSGWCAAPSEVDRHQNQRPDLLVPHSTGTGQGVVGQDNRKPRLDGGEGQYGHGVHAKGEKRPDLSGRSKRDRGSGVNKVSGEQLHQKRIRAPRENGSQTGGDMPGVNGRPQLADAYSRGRGVHNDNHLKESLPCIGTGGNGDGTRGVVKSSGGGTCEQRLAWLLDWFGRLRDRLRTVRVCCGDWTRVCSSESVTTRLGTTGIFLDPPYGHGAGRNMKLYAVDSGDVAADVRRYCLERGGDPAMRICLAGYAGEGHEVLEKHGWECVAWKAAGGYGNRSDVGKENAAKERLWFSPHCVEPRTLFDGLEGA
jgi:hypothetical protein